MRVLLFFTAILCSLFANAEMGFFKKTDPKVPAVIRAATDSVFQIVTPQSETFTVYLNKDYATSDFQNKIANLKSKKMELQAGQMNFCVTNNLPVCIVYDDIAISTGFVVFDSQHIATNRHADENLLIQLRKELTKIGYTDNEVFEVFRNYPIPVKIAKNLKAIEGLGAKKIEYARWFDEAPPFITGATGIQYLNSDIILISTEAPIGKPLPISKVAIQPGDRLYVVGYPSLTMNRKQDHGVADSNGINEISISTGVMESVDHGFERIRSLGSHVRQTQIDIQNDLTVGEKNLKVQWDKVIFNNADSEHGASGSPYLNAAGEIVGIHSTGLLEYRGVLPSLSVLIGVRWPWQTMPVQDFQLLDF